MAETKTLAATVRGSVGKGAARSVRREGGLPGVIYGGDAPPVAVALSLHEVNKLIYAGGFKTTTFDIAVEGGGTERVIPRDYQLEPLKGRPIHVDFLRLRAGQSITVEVPVHAVGQDNSTAVKNGGVVTLARHAIALSVPADAIPEHVDVDVTDLAVGDSVHAGELRLPRGARLANAAEAELAVVTVTAPAATEEEASVAEMATTPDADQAADDTPATDQG